MPPLPAPLPPDERPVGQLVGEAIRLYGRRFTPALALGAAPAAFTLGVAALDGVARFAFAFAAGPVLLASALVGATLLASDVERPQIVSALVAAVPAFLPFIAARVFLFPGAYLLAVAWFALVGLAAPAALIEGRGAADSLRRAVKLARADFVHAMGAVAALAIIIALSIFLLFFLLAGFGDQTLGVAALLAIVVTGPLFFLGAALLYFDQEARERRPRARAPMPHESSARRT